MSEFGSLKHAANMVVHLQSAVANIQDGRKEWTNALGINTYLNNEIAKLHRETWIERYIISC